MNIPMIDSLFINVDVADYENELKKLLEVLAKKKTEAKLAATNSASAKVSVSIGNYTFEILPNGAKGHAYILHNNAFEIKFAQFRSVKQEFFPVALRIKSEYLWAVGYENAYRELKTFFEKNIGNVLEERVSRVDLCCHTDELVLKPNDDVTFKGNFFSHEVKTFRRKVSGMNFGSRSSGRVYCRIYNKTLEVLQKRQKIWFHDIWRENGLDTEKVWNVEFELKRDFLRNIGVNNVSDLFQSLKTLWQFCTYEWLVKTNLDRTRIERSTVDENWEKIQRAFDRFLNKGFISVEKQKEIEANILVPSIMGYLTTYGAQIGVNNYANVIGLISKRGKEYLNNKDTDFRKEVTGKRKLLLQESEVKNDE